MNCDANRFSDYHLTLVDRGHAAFPEAVILNSFFSTTKSTLKGEMAKTKVMK